MSSSRGWIGIDLDGTLAYYNPDDFPAIGAPIPEVCRRVRDLLEHGHDVRIFTARVSHIEGATGDGGTRSSEAFVADQRERIERWSEQVLGQRLPVTAIKDFQMVELWDDRCKQVLTNRGLFVEDLLEVAKDLLKAREEVAP